MDGKNAGVGLDELDEQLLALLARDGRMPTAEMARRLGLPPSTVRHRLSRLISEKWVRVTGVTNRPKLGYQATATFLVRAELTSIASVAERIARFPEAAYVGHVTGEHNLLCLAFFPSLEAVQEFVEAKLAIIPGVRDVESTIVMKTVKSFFFDSDGDFEEFIPAAEAAATSPRR